MKVCFLHQMKMIQEQLDALQADGDVLLSKGAGEDYILTYENELLTIKSGE